MPRRKEHPPPQGAPKALKILNFECSSYLLAHKKKCAITVIFLGHGKLGKLAKLLFIDFAKPFLAMMVQIDIIIR